MCCLLLLRIKIIEYNNNNKNLLNNNNSNSSNSNNNKKKELAGAWKTALEGVSCEWTVTETEQKTSSPPQPPPLQLKKNHFLKKLLYRSLAFSVQMLLFCEGMKDRDVSLSSWHNDIPSLKHRSLNENGYPTLARSAPVSVIGTVRLAGKGERRACQELGSFLI